MSRIPASSSKELAEQLQARLVPRSVPWICWEEWRQVRDQLFSSSCVDLDLGLKRIKAWKVRGRVPLSVEITAALVEAMSHDQQMRVHGAAPGTPLSDDALRMLYSLAAIRLVNGVVDPAQTARFAKSIASLASSAGIPRLLVDVRHEAAHNELPSLPMLRVAVRQALAWLCAYYWHLQERQLADTQRRLRSLLLCCHPQASAALPTSQAPRPSSGASPAGFSGEASGASRGSGSNAGGGGGKERGQDGGRDGGGARKRQRVDPGVVGKDAGAANTAGASGPTSGDAKNVARRARKLALAYVSNICSLGSALQLLVTVLLDGGILPGLPSPPGAAGLWVSAPSSITDQRVGGQGQDTSAGAVTGASAGNSWDGKLPAQATSSGGNCGFAMEMEDASDDDEDEEEEEEEGEDRDGGGSSQHSRNSWLWARRRGGARVWDTADSEGSAVNAWLQVLRWLAGPLGDLPGLFLRGAVSRLVQEEAALGHRGGGAGAGGNGVAMVGTDGMGVVPSVRSGGGFPVAGLMRWCGGGGDVSSAVPAVPPGANGAAPGVGQDATAGEQGGADARLKGLTRWACLVVPILSAAPDQLPATRHIKGAMSPNAGARGDGGNSAAAAKRVRVAAIAQEYMHGLCADGATGGAHVSARADEEGRCRADMRAANLAAVLKACLVGGAGSKYLKNIVTCIVQSARAPSYEGAKSAVHQLLASGKAGAAAPVPSVAAAATATAAAVAGRSTSRTILSKDTQLPAVTREDVRTMDAVSLDGEDVLLPERALDQAQGPRTGEVASTSQGQGHDKNHALRSAVASQQELLQRLRAQEQGQGSPSGRARKDDTIHRRATPRLGAGIHLRAQPGSTPPGPGAGDAGNMPSKVTRGGQGVNEELASLLAPASGTRSWPSLAAMCESGPAKRWRCVAKWRPCAIGLVPSRLTEGGELPEFWLSSAGAPASLGKLGDESGGAIGSMDLDGDEGRDALEAEEGGVPDGTKLIGQPRGLSGIGGDSSTGIDRLADASFDCSQDADAPWDAGQVAALLRTARELDAGSCEEGGWQGEDGLQGELSAGTENVEGNVPYDCNVMLQGDSYAKLSVSEISAVAGAVRLML